MPVPFSERPGRHERHLRRKMRNGLFPRPIEAWSDEDILEAQRRDHEELVAFLEELRDAVSSAARLGRNEESDVILELKARLEQLYERSAGLAEDQSDNQAALRQLIDAIMRSVQAAADGDSLAERELAQEAAARRLHFGLLTQPLVADLLAPDSPIAADELVPTLLSENADGLEAALQLFDREQLAGLIEQAEALIARGPTPAGVATSDLHARLQRMQSRLAALARVAELN